MMMQRLGRNGLMLAGLLALIGVMLAAWQRGGLLGLPRIRSDVTLEACGLSDLATLRKTSDFLASDMKPKATAEWPECAASVRNGLDDFAASKVESGLEQIRAGLRQCPDDLVLGNAYRMTLFRLKREALAAARREGKYNARLPDHLRAEPIGFLTELSNKHPTRETKLQLALAWVDQMLLYPALEVKAPSSVEAVKILTEILVEEPDYVPALFGRGLNHLHRPSRLVWPESQHVPPAAAVQDIARCVAIGRTFDVGSPRLRATLALTLGDAYLKAGNTNTGRSWWQIAENLDRSDDMAEAVRRRFAWRDESALDDLEAELDRCRAQLDQPLSDLSFMWN